ncbi:MAG: DNA starvation/stationary phase protection protein [Campylobacteraceae bacterium]|nr:DNA starvation/stationary phase protection protein [Campylobacteraceae bacterium]
MSKVIKKLNQIQADVWVLNVRFHNYHWNVKGKQFHAIHNATEGAYDVLFEIFDEVAERAIQLGGKAIVCPKALLESAKVSKVEKDSFTSKEAIEYVLEDYKYLLKEFNELAELADEAGDRVTAAMADEYIAKYEKEIWMLGQTLA